MSLKRNDLLNANLRNDYDDDDWDWEPDLVIGQGDGLGRSDSEDRIPILETLTEPIGFGRDKEWWTMEEKTILEIVATVFEELEDEQWFEGRSPRTINRMEQQIASYCVSEFGENKDNDERENTSD